VQCSDVGLRILWLAVSVTTGEDEERPAEFGGAFLESSVRRDLRSARLLNRSTFANRRPHVRGEARRDLATRTAGDHDPHRFLICIPTNISHGFISER
jgi:hypothetical protein